MLSALFTDEDFLTQTFSGRGKKADKLKTQLNPNKMAATVGEIDFDTRSIQGSLAHFFLKLCHIFCQNFFILFRLENIIIFMNMYIV